MAATQLQDVRVNPPEEQLKKTLNPGDVSFRHLERKDGQFVVTFAWGDMLGGTHEHTFNRGDIFADFNKVMQVFTDGGLPIDPEKIPEFQKMLCKLSTVLMQQQEGAQA